MCIRDRSVDKEYNVTSIDGLDGFSEEIQSAFEDCITLKDEKTVSGTDVGNYDMELTSESFECSNTNFRNVKFVVTDGALSITRLNVFLVADSAEKTFDGFPLTCDDYAVYYDANENPDTLPEDAELTFDANPKDLPGGAKITAIFSEESKRTDVGKTDNIIESYTIESGNNSNYFVIPVAGELEIKQAGYKIQLEAGSATFTYDGQPQSVGLASATLNYGCLLYTSRPPRRADHGRRLSAPRITNATTNSGLFHK